MTLRRSPYLSGLLHHFASGSGIYKNAKLMVFNTLGWCLCGFFSYNLRKQGRCGEKVSPMRGRKGGQSRSGRFILRMSYVWGFILTHIPLFKKPEIPSVGRFSSELSFPLAPSGLSPHLPSLETPPPFGFHLPRPAAACPGHSSRLEPQLRGIPGRPWGHKAFPGKDDKGGKCWVLVMLLKI